MANSSKPDPARDRAIFWITLVVVGFLAVLCMAAAGLVFARFFLPWLMSC